MVVNHTGKSIPVYPLPFDPQSKKWIWFNYPASVQINDSEFIVESPLVVVETKLAQTVVIDGITYTNANGVFIDFNGAKERSYLITNRINMVNTERDDKSCYVVVRNT
jgi:hypothetical protein